MEALHNLNIAIAVALIYTQFSAFLEFCVYPRADSFFRWLFMSVIVLAIALSPFNIKFMRYVTAQAPVIKHPFYRVGIIGAIALYYLPIYWGYWSSIMVSVGSIALILFAVISFIYSL